MTMGPKDLELLILDEDGREMLEELVNMIDVMLPDAYLDETCNVQVEGWLTFPFKKEIKKKYMGAGWDDVRFSKATIDGVECTNILFYNGGNV